MSKIQFIHRRPIQNGLIANSGGFTVAYMEDGPNGIHAAFAQCSRRDNFNKRLGRTVAAGRLEQGVSQFWEMDATEFREAMFATPV